jgi:oxygen-independent coproporphyrinogen-3 oxidase
MVTLKQLADPSPLTSGTPYAAYAYSYPHKTAYRPLAPPRPLDRVWADEPRDAVYLYLHIPFCEMRCGFCNLFTTANPRDETVDRYVDALWRQARVVREAVGPARVARMAVGGGTPTYLSAGQLERVLTVAAELFGVDGRAVPTSVETSPRTADADKLAVLWSFGVSRVSIGIQSFVESEVGASGRAQKNAWVDAAVGRIRDAGFPTLNLDLIYGLPGQTVASWLASLDAALRWRPEELYLYPLYVRPLTGLERWGRQAEDELRLACYRHGRDRLLADGYEQVSMRMFRRHGPAVGLGAGASDVGTEYVCQQDGMIGLGCGARSYTPALHYSSEYAVGSAGVREIIGDYVAKPEVAFAVADYGCELNAAEQRRRWVIKSLLRAEGLDLSAYAAHFGTDATVDVPELAALAAEGFVERSEDRLVPTSAGLERSDAIGPWLYSEQSKTRMDAYEVR